MSKAREATGSIGNQSTKHRNLFQVNEEINSFSIQKRTKSPKHSSNYRSCSVDKEQCSLRLDLVRAKTRVKARGSIDSARTQRLYNKKFKPMTGYFLQSRLKRGDQGQVDNELRLKSSTEKKKINPNEGSKTPSNTKLKQQLLLTNVKKKAKVNHSIDLSNDSFSKAFQLKKKEFSRILASFKEIKFLGNDFIGKRKKERLSLDAFEDVDDIGLLFSYFEHKKINQSVNEAYKELNKNKRTFEVVFISRDVSEKEFLENYSSLPGLAIPYEKTCKHAKDLMAKFDVKTLPSLIVISKKGKVVMKLNKKQIVSQAVKKLICFNDPIAAAIEQKVPEVKVWDFSAFISQFPIRYLNGDKVKPGELMHLDLIAYYKPSLNLKQKLKEETVLNALITEVNEKAWRIALIVVQNPLTQFLSVKRLQKRKHFPLMEVNCDLQQYECGDLESDGLMICDNKHNIITREGFHDIERHQYNSFSYWTSNQITSSFSSHTQALGNAFIDRQGNALSSLPNKDLLLINFYSNEQEEVAISKDILSYLYLLLKAKIAFVNINMHLLSQAPIAFPFPYPGLYINTPDCNLKRYLTETFHINSLSALPRLMLTTPTFLIIKEYTRSELQSKGLSLFNNLINPSVCFNAERLKQILGNSYDAKDGTRSIEDLSNYNLICLYFGDLESAKSKAVTTALVEAYNNINRMKKRVEIIYFPQDKTLRHLKNATKEVPFPCCDFDSNDVYMKYSKGRKGLKLIVVELTGNILIENAIEEFLLKGELLFKEIFEGHLGMRYDISALTIELSFLGEEFIDRKGNRITRDRLLSHCEFIGVYFYSARCPFSHQFSLQLALFLNESHSSSTKLIEILLNPIDTDKDLYYTTQKKLNSVIIPYDFKDNLIRLFNQPELGVPSLLIFTPKGALITATGVEDIQSSPSTAFDKWRTVK